MTTNQQYPLCAQYGFDICACYRLPLPEPDPEYGGPTLEALEVCLQALEEASIPCYPNGHYIVAQALEKVKAIGGTQSDE